MKTTILTAALLITTLSAPAHAGFLDSVNKLATAVDQLDTAAETLEGTANRLNTTEPASGSSTAEEAEILRKAQEIEDRKILEEADRIRSRRSAQ